MPDLNLDPNYFSHRKTKRLIDLLCKGAEVLPLKLWCYCGRHHARDGKLTGYSEQEIEKLVDWWGKRGACVTALIEAGFLVKLKAGYAVRNWREHQGHFALYEDRARHAATVRWDRERAAKANACSSAASIPPATQGRAMQGRANGAAPTAAERRKAAFHARLQETGGNGR